VERQEAPLFPLCTIDNEGLKKSNGVGFVSQGLVRKKCPSTMEVDKEFKEAFKIMKNGA
jgi:hypothetical protein